MNAEKSKPVSRQRRWQLKMERENRCRTCGAPAVPDHSTCLKHMVLSNRKYTGAAKTNCASHRETVWLRLGLERKAAEIIMLRLGLTALQFKYILEERETAIYAVHLWANSDMNRVKEFMRALDIVTKESSSAFDYINRFRLVTISPVEVTAALVQAMRSEDVLSDPKAVQ